MNPDLLNILQSIDEKLGTLIELQSKKRKSRSKPKVGIVDRKKVFYNDVSKFTEKYNRHTLRKFYDYWTEENPSKTKMKFEMEQTWDTSKRIALWASREKGFTGIKSDGIGRLPPVKPLPAKEELPSTEEMKRIKIEALDKLQKEKGSWDGRESRNAILRTGNTQV